MNFIKIEPLENGAHANRMLSSETTVPEGWAVIPEGMELPSSFPFVDIETEEKDGVLTVTSMTAREVPESTETEPDPVPTTAEQIAALQEQNEMLKQCLMEMSEVVYA